MHVSRNRISERRAATLSDSGRESENRRGSIVDVGPGTALGRVVFTRWFFFWVALTSVGLLVGLGVYAARRAAGQEAGLVPVLAISAMRSQLWFALCPAVVWLDRRYPFPRQWTSWLASHAGILVLACAAHTFVAALAISLFEAGSPFGTTFAAILPSNTMMTVIAYKMIVTSNVAFDYAAKYNESRLREARLETQLARAQLQALRMQMHPHFLFNTLNAVSSLALSDPRAAVQMVTLLGDFLRMTLDSDDSERVELEREIEFVRCYLAIQKVRLGDRLEVEIHVDLATESALVPTMLLQPLVENAIKHGAAVRGGSTRISVRTAIVDEQLRIEIANDTLALSDSAFSSAPGWGIGLSSTAERLRQLYAERGSVRLGRLGNGMTVAAVDMPFETSELRMARGVLEVA